MRALRSLQCAFRSLRDLDNRRALQRPKGLPCAQRCRHACRL